jgi:energy-coupling factor transporter ATP-binding protein EcfA2
VTTIIALCGPAGAGKTTVASHLVGIYGAKRYSFATPLKEMVRLALDLSYDQVYGTQEQKEAEDPRYNRSPRWLLQRIGTEGCRAVFGDDFFVKQTLALIARDNAPLAVIEDLRFNIESKAVLDDPHGFVWRLHPVDDAVSAERAAAAGKHSSEEQWRALEASLEIKPTERGIPQLLEMIDKAMCMISARGVR